MSFGNRRGGLGHDVIEATMVVCACRRLSAHPPDCLNHFSMSGANRFVKNGLVVSDTISKSPKCVEARVHNLARLSATRSEGLVEAPAGYWPVSDRSGLV